MFIYVWGMYTGRRHRPNSLCGRPGAILESGLLFFMIFSLVVSSFANSLVCRITLPVRTGCVRGRTDRIIPRAQVTLGFLKYYNINGLHMQQQYAADCTTAHVIL